MVVTKKLKELTAKELNACGWIERIAYRGNENWTMYDFEAGDFNKINVLYPIERLWRRNEHLPMKPAG